MDDYVPILGLLGGCMVISGAECAHERIPETMIRKLSSRNSAEWEKAIMRKAQVPQTEKQTNRQSFMNAGIDIWFTCDTVKWLTDVSSPVAIAAREDTKPDRGEQTA